MSTTRILIFLLLTIPLSFKVEILPGVRFLIQEPFILFFTIIGNFHLKKFNIKSLPFLFLAISLLIILLSSIFSLFRAFDPIGTIKTLKYLMYALAVFTILKNPTVGKGNLEDFLLKITLIVVLISLGQYFYWFLTFGKTWQQFVSFTTWNAEYMPTGFSNTVFDLSDATFKRVGGNHGIYGSYLVLVLILAVNRMIITGFLKGKIITSLILVNIGFITSRETILLLVLTLFFYFLHYLITNPKLKKNLLLITTGVGIVGILALVIWTPDIVIINKINHMISSFQDSGGFDNNVNYRLNTWYLFFTYAFAHPWILLFGVGNNGQLFRQLLDFQEVALGGSYPHALVPESFYVTTLAYGGVLALIFGLIFFIALVYILYWSGKQSRILSFYVLALMVTNLTGASILAEILISQLGLVSLICFTRSGGITR